MNLSVIYQFIKEHYIVITVCLISWIFIGNTSAKTQSNSHDDCDGCTGSKCSSDIIYLNVTATQKTLTSPNYPQNYDPNEFCRWVLSTSLTNYAVRVQIEAIRILSNTICKEDYLLIQDGSGLYSPKLRTCCMKACPDNSSITSTESSLRLTFKTDHFRNDRGFKLRYWAVAKKIKEEKEPVYTATNYILFTIFGVTMCSILLSLLGILVIGNRNNSSLIRSDGFNDKLKAQKYSAMKSEQSNGSAKPVPKIDNFLDEHTHIN